MKNALLVVFVILVVGVIHELPLHGQTGLSLPPEEEVSKKTFIIPLHGMIDGGLFSSLKRRTALALSAGTGLIIFDIDTYGGRLEPAFDISDHIAGIKDVKTVCYISKKAISAGALIAISCNEIIMAPESEIGDCEPIIPSVEGSYQTAGEKIQTVLRAKFRKFAEKNGYPVILAEAMVTKEIEAYYITTEEKPEGFFISGKELDTMTEEEKKGIKSKKLIVGKDELLTMHAREAHEYGFAKHLVEDQDALLKLYNLSSKDVTTLETNWSEDMVRFLESIAPILLGVGLLALWMEFKSPGFGLPGIVGILCLATVFLSKYLVGLANAPEIIIFVAGIALLAIEMFLIPGFGLFGITGIGCILLGLILSFQDFIVPRTPANFGELRMNIFVILCSLLGSATAGLVLLRFMPGIPVFRRIVLRTAEKAEFGFVSSIPIIVSKLVGKKGIAVTTLRPTGKIEVENEFYDVVTEGDFVEKGRVVEVTEVRGNRIVVKPL
ncbi:MAG TPA: NfeD family protein [Candidatus Brocadiia bacterium]|nr:NfeD family protein [Candidatus Brocadiales bacterium]